MSNSLHCLLFGTPELLDNGKPVTGFISSKARALLYYLLITGCTQSRDHLATLFWGHMPTAAARKNLTKALSNLRKLLGDRLVADRHSAMVDLDGATVDLHTVQNLLQKAVADANDSAEDAHRFSLDCVAEADHLFRGPLLGDLTVGDAPEFELWLDGLRRDSLHQLIATLNSVAERAMQAGALDVALALADRVLTREPTNEAAHRRKMTVLIQQGNGTLALQQYEKCQTLLAQELGVEPESETTRLYESIRGLNEPSPHNLPKASTPFIGRERELLALRAVLCSDDCRLFTITGAGGVGKTRLALQLAEEFVQPTITPAFALHATASCSFVDGIYFLPLTSLDNADTVIAMLAERLGFTYYDEGDSRQQLLDALQDKELLLVLDNVEHLVNPTDTGATAVTPASLQLTNPFLTLIDQLLASAPRLKFLMTSRTRLNLQGERLYSLGGLHYPPQADLSTESASMPVDDPFPVRATAVESYSAIQLFIQSARRLQSEYVLLEQDRPAVIHICQMVQGMPLGILLAAAWMDIYSPIEIADEISRSLDFLAADLPDLPPRQRSIRAAIDYSWRLLTVDEQELFQQLSIFRGSFSRHAAQQITDATARRLQSLVKKSLLQPITDGRFMVHELLRQYADEKLAANDAVATDLRDRHSQYFAQATAAWAVALKDERQQQTLKAMDIESENLQVAWQWLVATGNIETQLAMLHGLYQFYLWRGRYHEGASGVSAALERLSFARVSTTQFDGSDHVNDARDMARDVARLRILLATWYAHFLRLLGDGAEAEARLEEALRALHTPHFAEEDVAEEDVAGTVAFVWLQLGNTLRERDRQRAQHCYEKSLSAYHTIEDQWGMANALADHGWLIQHWGAYDRARQTYERSLEIRQQLRDQRGIAGCLRALGGITLYQGNHSEAEELIRRSIAIYGDMDDQAGIAAGLGKLGEALTLQGHMEKAIDPLQESAAIYHTLGLQADKMFARAVLAHTQIHRGQYGDAAHHAYHAETHFRQQNAQRGIAYAALIRGWAMLAQSAFADANILLHESATIYETIGQLDELGQAQALLGVSAYQQGDMQQARVYYAQAQRTAERIQAFMPSTLVRLLAELLSYRSARTTQRAEPRDPLNPMPTSPVLVEKSHWFATLRAKLSLYI